ncbi:MAG: molybdopterin-dependent oxidoreductase [Microthrixaceae bacterium]
MSPPGSPRFAENPPWLIGLVAAGLGLGTGELLAALVSSIRSPLLAIADRVVDLSPAGVRDWAIQTLGTLDKPALIVGTLVILGLAATGLGRLAVRDTKSSAAACAIAFAVGLLGALAAWTGRNSGPASGAGALLGGAVSAGALWWLTHDPVSASPEGPHDRDRSDIDTPLLLTRRTTLGGLGLVALVQLALAGAVQVVGGRGKAQAARDEVTLPEADRTAPPLPHDPATTATDGPTPVDGLSPLVTPTGDFYRIDTAFVPPSVDPDGWSLTIAGGSNGPLTLSYADLLGREQVEIDCTLSCVSNEVGGDLVGNARWQGVELRSVLEEAGIPASATQVGATSTDGWTCGFPIEALERPAGDATPPALIALGMGGEPLPIIHGFPARLVIPGLYGYVSACKWVERIELTTWEDFTGYWIPRGWSREAPIKTQSRIDVPADSATVNAGAATVAGVAWAGRRALANVEVRVDGGPWRPATLGPELSNATWRQWWWEWDATPGEHTLTVRATDGEGDTQTAKPGRPDPDGATGHHRVVVNVR